eukprot:SAG31_NODE_1578_length_7835_cov_6.998449_1_plen_263_part_00
MIIRPPISLRPPVTSSSMCVHRCGGFANKECQEAPATGATEVCKDQIPIDEEAEAYEAERADVDRANMIDAVRIAKELASRDGDLNADSLGRHNRCDLKKENKAMALRCPGHNVIEAIDFASYGTPSGQCVDNSGEHNFQIDSECHAPGSQEFVERKCMGKNWCEVAATNQDFSDPCYGKVRFFIPHLLAPVSPMSFVSLQLCFCLHVQGKMLAVVVRCSTGRTQPDLPAGIDPDPAKRPSLPPLPRVTMRQLQKRPDLLKG